MAKRLRLLFGMFAVLCFLALTQVSYASAVANGSPSTLKSVNRLKKAGQLAANLQDDLLKTAISFRQQPNYSPDLHAEAATSQSADLCLPVLVQTPQILFIYKHLYYRFLLYPFHAFW